VKILLDTVTFLSLVEGSPQLSSTGTQLVEDISNVVYLSAASGWEIATKSVRGKLKLAQPAWRLVPKQRELHGFESLPINEEAALHAARLPHLHRDPFDRMLVSQAILNGLTLLTPGPLITSYAVKTLW